MWISAFSKGLLYKGGDQKLCVAAGCAAARAVCSRGVGISEKTSGLSLSDEIVTEGGCMMIFFVGF